MSNKVNQAYRRLLHKATPWTKTAVTSFNEPPCPPPSHKTGRDGDNPPHQKKMATGTFTHKCFHVTWPLIQLKNNRQMYKLRTYFIIPAIANQAFEWLFAWVDSQMSSQIGILREWLHTNVTLIWLLSWVGTHVRAQGGRAGVHLVT